MNYQGETYPRSQQTFSSRSNHYGFTWHCLEYQIKKGVWHRIGMAIARRCRWTEAIGIYTFAATKTPYFFSSTTTNLSFARISSKVHRKFINRKLLLLGKRYYYAAVWETGLWMKSANEAESERQRRTGGLNHVWATEKGPAVYENSRPGPPLLLWGLWLGDEKPRVVARNRWLAAQRERRKFWTEFARNAEITSVALEIR